MTCNIYEVFQGLVRIPISIKKFQALTYMKVQMACVVGNYVVNTRGIIREWAYRFTSDQGKPCTLPMLSMKCFDVETIKFLALDSRTSRRKRNCQSTLGGFIRALSRSASGNQIVGHNPVESIIYGDSYQRWCNVQKSKLIFCDTSSLATFDSRWRWAACFG